MGAGRLFRQTSDAIERWLEAERDQLVLWLPVMLGAGITSWFVLPDARAWIGFLVACAALALIGLAISGHGRLGRIVLIGAVTMAAGCSLVWWRAESVAAPVLARPALVTMSARVERVEPIPARELMRLTLAPVGRADLPPLVRVNLDAKNAPAGISRGAMVSLRARLMPPPSPAVPGAYDFARVAWFSGLGATGKGLAPVMVTAPGEAAGSDLRASLSAHIEAALPGSAGGIASALATGDEGAISDADTQAMQRSGLAHLLSVSGLHVSAVTAVTMWIVMRLLALSPWLALRWRLPLLAAAAGALAAIGYTWLTGAQVPTMRSCAAALMVLAALSLGREAITLRLVAVGAFFVLLLWPESLAGPSFQLSFAAVTAIIALHEHPRVSAMFMKRDEGRGRKLLRELGSLLLTGMVVELALIPIGMFHFHRQGVYGAVANIVAIPLTTFVIMPLEALALLLDLVGIGGPVWWATGQAMALLLWIAHAAANAPGAMASLPAMPGGSFALMVAGGLWLGLWKSRVRLVGWVPLVVGAVWALMTPAPDLLVTGDGRHLAIRMPDGGMALLRDRAGDYTRDMLSENSGDDDGLDALAEQPGARCSLDLCLIDVTSGGRRWRVAATRSSYVIPWEQMTALCRGADIVVSDRRLPRGCTPRWMKLDREALAKVGGVAVTFSNGRVVTVSGPAGRHPWVDPATVMPPPDHPYPRNDR